MIKIDPPLVLTVTAVLAIGIPYVLWKIPVVGKWIPLVVLQILVGVLLGPSILGSVIGMENHKLFFGGANLAAINAVAILAVIIFAFLAGVGTDTSEVKKSAGTTLTTGLVSLFAPMAIGALVALGIAAWFPSAVGTITPASGGPPVPVATLPYALGFGLALSITALPVLAAILNEMRLMSKPIASVALAGAGVGNAFIWVGLGIVNVLATGGGSIVNALLIALAGAVAIVGIWLFIARPMLNRVAPGPGSMSTILTIAVIFAAISGGIAHVTKLHFILGAFAAGLLVPDQHRKAILSMLDRPVNLVLVPYFFVVAGLATVIQLGDPSLYIIAVIGLLIAIFAKIIPTALAARACGQTAAFGAALGIMHMTKGLVGVALAFALVSSGVFGPSTYTAMIFVCIICTAFTAPALLIAANASPAIKEIITPDGEAPAAAPAAPTPAARPATA